MPKSHEIRADMNNSSVLSTSRSTTTVPLSKFNAEMNAKNEAYHFILAYGLFDLFLEFCKEHRGQDHHDGCVEILLTKIQKETK